MMLSIFIMVICSLLTVNGRSLESTECMTGPEHNYRQAWYQSDWCCDSCPKGQHMTGACIRGQPTTTQCDWCESDTYTAYPNLLDNCNPQGHCDPERQVIKTPASITTKLECECKYGYYELIGGGCAHWTVCKKGFGVLRQGTNFDDVICQSCPAGTYSDKDDMSMECLSHTRCGDVGMITIEDGTRQSDAICAPVPTSTVTVDVKTRKYSTVKRGDNRQDIANVSNDINPLVIHGGTMHFEEQSNNDSNTGKYILVSVICVLSAIVIAIGILVYGYHRLQRRQRIRRNGDSGNDSGLQVGLTSGHQPPPQQQQQQQQLQVQSASSQQQQHMIDGVIHGPRERYENETQTRAKNNAEPISNAPSSPPSSAPSTNNTNTETQANPGGSANITVNTTVNVINVEGSNTRHGACVDRSYRPPDGAASDTMSIHTDDDEETKVKLVFGESLTEGHAETGEPKHKTSHADLRQAIENAAGNVDSGRQDNDRDGREIIAMCTEDPEHNIDDIFEKDANYALQPLITPETRRRDSELSDGANNYEEEDGEFIYREAGS